MSSIVNIVVTIGVAYLLKEFFSAHGDYIIDCSTRLIISKYNSMKSIDYRNVLVYKPSIEQGKFRQLRHSVSGRTIDSLILPAEAHALVNNIEQFFSVPKTSQLFKCPQRYGVMLYGPPGTGKTQFVLALATKLNVPLYSLTLSSVFLGDESIRTKVFSSFTEKSIVFIDDVDAIFQTQMVANGKLQIDTLLSSIDGVYVPSNIVYIIACNDVSKLPVKFTRRFPHVVTFDYPKIADAIKLFKYYFADADENDVLEFTNIFDDISESRSKLGDTDQIKFSDIEGCMKKVLYSQDTNNIKKFLCELRNLGEV